MSQILVSWVGNTDLRAVTEAEAVGLGPIAQAVRSRDFDEIVLISDYPEPRVRPYLEWLGSQTSTPTRCELCTLTGPTNFGEIYEVAAQTVAQALPGHQAGVDLTFHLSPGTPAMAAVWIILAKTRFPAELIESSREGGVRIASVPFDISAEFIPDLLRRPDERLARLSEGLPPGAPEFESIVHRSAAMKRIIAKARRVAPRSVPVLIEGESGTGKELLARAIHRSSPRRGQAFLAINCGAIPRELVESELFGHRRGAFTGATMERKGYFEEAVGGTLFLDEVGELPLAAQVKLLRVLQENEVTPVGASKPVSIDVRITAATNRDLVAEVSAGRFRTDLFYRLAVATLKLPPLRDRKGDLSLLVDHLVEQVNEESQAEPGHKKKGLSPSARQLLLSRTWPGNVRELLNTLRQATIWSAGDTITEDDIRESLLPPITSGAEGVLHLTLGQGLDLRELIAQVARHYLERAMSEAHGNKTKAAALIGLPSYQTLTNWLSKYGAETGDGQNHSRGSA